MTREPLKKFFADSDSTKELSDSDLDAMFPHDRLFERVQSALMSEPIARIQKRLWRRTATISVTAILVLAGTAAAISLLRAPVRDVTRLTCFEGVSLTSKAAVVPYSADPLAACGSAMHWPSAPRSPSPEGSLCVLGDGSLAGFPPSRTVQVCEVLGLPTFNGQLKNPADAAFERTSQSIFTEHPCMALLGARREVLRLIGKFGLTRWRVRISGSRSPRACATLAIDVKARRVGIIGIERTR